MKIHASCLSGRGVTLEVSDNCTVEELAREAAFSFQAPIFDIVDAHGNHLNPLLSCSDAGLHHGSSVTVIASAGIEVISTTTAFVAYKPGGTELVAWGDAGEGGNCEAVLIRSPLLLIVATQCAFAALQLDGEVVAWGDEKFGGDCSTVQGRLKSVRQLIAHQDMFIGITSEFRVVAWGGQVEDDYVRSLQEMWRFTSVRSMVFSESCYAALMRDGSATAWGNSPYNKGEVLDFSSTLPSLATGVEKIVATAKGGFAALKSDGSVVAWGDASHGGSTFAVEAFLGQSRVVELIGNDGAFAARTSDGAVIAWGSPEAGGQISARNRPLLDHVTQLCALNSGFAALCFGGEVVAWGVSGSMSRSMREKLSRGVRKLSALPTVAVVVAELLSGELIAWGDEYALQLFEDPLTSIPSSVAASDSAYAVVQTGPGARPGKARWAYWCQNEEDYGENVRPAPDSITSGVTKVAGNQCAFVAVKDDGELVTWGNARWGGQADEEVRTFFQTRGA